MNRKGIKVLLFDKDIYQKPYLDTLTSKELYEFALADDENVSIYDDVDAFQGDFNDGAILISIICLCMLLMLRKM